MSATSSTLPVNYSRIGFTISTNPELMDVTKIHRYLSEQSYWAQGINRDQVERSIHFSLCFGVYFHDAVQPLQVGFARVITDYSTFAYLADMFILSDYQGQNLGKWLVATILDHSELQSVRRWALYTQDAHELYRRFGFDAEQEPQRYMSYRPHFSNSELPGIERR